MRLREYEYILAIAEARNMTRAAEALHISQPALSRLLSDVEGRYGKPLFYRNGRDMIPTAFGDQYLLKVRQLVALNDELEQQLMHDPARDRKLTITMPLIYSDFFSNECVPKLTELYPNVHFKSRSCHQSEIGKRLMKQECALALGIITDEYAELFDYKVIGTQEMALVVPSVHPLIGEAEIREDYTYPYVSPEKLAHLSFIMPSDNSHSGKFARTFFAEHSLSPKISLELSFTAPIYRTIAASHHRVAILPSIPARFLHLEDTLNYLSINPSSQGDVIGIMYLRGHTLSDEEEALVSIMRSFYTNKE